MTNKSEGVRRITITISWLAVIGWALFVIDETNWFQRGVKGADWIIVLGGFIVAYLIPQVVVKIAYWILEGFNSNSEK